MKVVITGAAGFIGCHLVEACLNRGWSVIGIDNLSNGNLKNIEFAKNSPDFHFVLADINDQQKVSPLFENIDYVFHLAGLADIVPSINHPVDYHNANVTGTINVLEYAKKYGIKKFVYAASSSCYGIPEIYPTPENAPCSPQYPYALSKMLGESYVLHWGQVYKLPVISLRLFNVYGPKARTNGNYGAVFKTFLAQKISKKPFTVVGDGSQKRDFIFVTDIARAFVMAAESPLKQLILNVGTGNAQSVNRLIELLEGEVEYLPSRPGEPMITEADISLIKNKLNWEPLVSFEEGVAAMLKTLDYWKDAKLWSAEEIGKETAAWFNCLSDHSGSNKLE